jgi:hypothetical protein
MEKNAIIGKKIQCMGKPYNEMEKTYISWGKY